MRILISFVSGSLFGIGLYISGMTDTARVIGWLDIFGRWDPTLAFVMGGAIVPMFFAWRFARFKTPYLASEFPKVSDTHISRRLIMGSLLFGAGWGLAGLCPGPAMASLSFGGGSGIIFMAAMLIGFLVAVRVKKWI